VIVQEDILERYARNTPVTTLNFATMEHALLLIVTFHAAVPMVTLDFIVKLR
jgi:hypothetical protein